MNNFEFLCPIKLILKDPTSHISDTMEQPIHVFIDNVYCNLCCVFMSCKECRILK
jgi:hypothetical protein